jgi:hypothetical protein
VVVCGGAIMSEERGMDGVQGLAGMGRECCHGKNEILHLVSAASGIKDGVQATDHSTSKWHTER